MKKYTLFLAVLIISVISLNAKISNGNNDVNFTPNIKGIVPTTCGIPSGLTASSITDVSAILSWTAISDAFSYNIRYRVVGASSWSAVNAILNPCTISGLTELTRYEYQVQTVCELGKSDFSASYFFNTSEGTSSCGTPSGLVANSITDASATLSWNAISGVTSYNIQYREDGSTIWQSVNTALNSVTVNNLSELKRYEYQVQTICPSGKSEYSASSLFITQSWADYSIPTGLTSGSITDASSTINWSVVSGATSYNLQYRVKGAASWTLVNTLTNSYTITGLADLTSYEYQVQAVNATEETNFSTSSFFTTLETAVSLEVPSGLSASSITATSVIVSWTAVSGAIKYNVQYRVKGATVWHSIIEKFNTHTITELTASTRYEYQVQAVSESGKSDYSTSSFFNTLAVTIVGRSNTEISSLANAPLFPNPAVNKTTISYNAEEDNMITIRLYDITGKTINTNEYSALKGFNNFTIDLSNINKGLYIVEINDGINTIVKKLFIDK